MTTKIFNNPIVINDLARIHERFYNKEKLQNSTILITGCAGFLGFYFLHYLIHYQQALGIKKIIGVDNFITGERTWIDELNRNNSGISVQKFDIIKQQPKEIEGIEEANFVLHMASIASPVYYRKYPLETLDANVTGLRNLLDYFCQKDIRGFLGFSSSEVYGDPTLQNIPTPESYNGNVSSIGPRACYDEAKRMSETLCYLYNQKYNMPITLVRPFNNFGPGMSVHDKRVPADFAKAILNKQDIVILSDGKPTRSYCYISDAITGYLQALTHHSFDIFNIGNDRAEISVLELARQYANASKELFNFEPNIEYQKSEDKNYLANNPNRRAPVLAKARNLLKYDPQVLPQEGIKFYLSFLANQ